MRRGLIGMFNLFLTLTDNNNVSRIINIKSEYPKVNGFFSFPGRQERLLTQAVELISNLNNVYWIDVRS